MRGSGSGYRFSGAIAVAGVLVLSSFVPVGRADSLAAPLDYSLVVADATFAAETPRSEILKFSDPDSYALPPSIIAADSSQARDAASDEAEQSSPVPEPSGIVLGAFFAALLALVTLLRWRFDRTAVQS